MVSGLSLCFENQHAQKVEALETWNLSGTCVMGGSFCLVKKGGKFMET